MNFIVLSIFILNPFNNFIGDSLPVNDFDGDTIKKIYRGIDISRYQTDVEYDSITLDFVIIKKTEGLTINDVMFKNHFENIETLKGVYHFFRPECDGEEQAKFFLKGLDTSELDLIPVLDVEDCSTWSKNKELGIKNLKKFVNYIETIIGCKPIIYTSPLFWNRYINIDIGCLLWVADYRVFDSPEIPCGFDDWVIWQKTSKYKTNIIKGYVDFNICKDIDVIKYHKN